MAEYTVGFDPEFFWWGISPEENETKPVPCPADVARVPSIYRHGVGPSQSIDMFAHQDGAAFEVTSGKPVKVLPKLDGVSINSINSLAREMVEFAGKAAERCSSKFDLLNTGAVELKHPLLDVKKHPNHPWNRIGCAPYLDAHSELLRDEGPKQLYHDIRNSHQRGAGGHIHMGAPFPKEIPPAVVALFCDLYILLPYVMGTTLGASYLGYELNKGKDLPMTSDFHKRIIYFEHNLGKDMLALFYGLNIFFNKRAGALNRYAAQKRWGTAGTPGAYREKKYGIEYRSLPVDWMLDGYTRRWTSRAIRRTMRYLCENSLDGIYAMYKSVDWVKLNRAIRKMTSYTSVYTMIQGYYEAEEVWRAQLKTAASESINFRGSMMATPLSNDFLIRFYRDWSKNILAPDWESLKTLHGIVALPPCVVVPGPLNVAATRDVAGLERREAPLNSLVTYFYSQKDTTMLDQLRSATK